MLSPDQILHFLGSVHPWDTLESAALTDLSTQAQVLSVETDKRVYALGDSLPGQFLVHEGLIEISDSNGAVVSHLGPRNTFGERGLLRDGRAVTSARAEAASTLIILPRPHVLDLINTVDAVARFFDRSRPERPQPATLASARVDSFMTRAPATCPPDMPVQQAAQIMSARGISSLCVTTGDTLEGIATLRDLSGKVVGKGLPFDTPIGAVMTAAPLTLGPDAIGSDVLHAMMERHIGHIPIAQGGSLIGIVTQTDLTRFQAISSGEMVRDIAQAQSAEDMARTTADIPALLVQLVAGGHRHQVVTRLITDITDTVTRRLLALAEAKLGTPPVPYLWLACGSQGRQEQTGVSDQDNCLMIDDAMTPDHEPYFTALAQFVCDGLNTCGYVYCPGDMMASALRWRQPVRVWRDYFAGWIAKPNPEAQMLASVMFDLRPIGGDPALFEGLQVEVLGAAAKNSIFVAHMIANSLKHTPPLSMFRGFSTIRAGEHRNTLDLKHSGVVPVVDLGRIYALQGQLTEANTRARLQAAQASGTLSPGGARDLLDAYDLIAETRLEHQAKLIRQGAAPDNFLPPSNLSDFERSHLRDAFVVVKTMQSAAGQGKGMLG